MKVVTSLSLVEVNKALLDLKKAVDELRRRVAALEAVR